MQIGFSPCPNDTFIFYAMLHNKVEMEGLTFEPYISDVEDLNRKAFAEEIPVTKLSFHTYFALQDKYKLLTSGAALGRGCGPLLISKHPIAQDEVKNKVVAIPGKLTTANFLLHSFFPEVKEKKEMVFSDIEQALLDERVEAGVIIHENRFTYQLKGLKKIADLGELWEQTTKHAIPLGGIAVNRSQPEGIQAAINRVMKRSVEYAWANQDKVMPYVKHYSQAMSENIMWQHIKLYVNDFTTDLGEEGIDAVRYMQQYEVKGGFIKDSLKDIFVS
jgi:1,4-dihydroxy-6-naphthoate synthase